MIVVTAQRGGTIRETIAMAEAYGEARKQHGESELLDEIVSAKPEMDHTRYHSAEELKESGLKHLREAVQQVGVLLDVALDDRLILGRGVRVRVAVMIVFDVEERIDLAGQITRHQQGGNPRAIGLCFAGSSRNSIANPIGEVLAFLGASMVGN